VPAWIVSSDRLEVIVTQTGAHIAALRSPGEDLNPLWQPHWPASDSQEAATGTDLYGEPPESRLLATICGHNLCLDRFGAPWPGENKPVHGEAGVVLWSQTQPDPGQVSFAAEFPEAGLSVTRRIRMAGEELTVGTDVSRFRVSDGVIEWAEHVTVGDPFLEDSDISAGVDAAWISSVEPAETWRFSGIRAEDEVNPEAALEMPGPDSERAVGDVITARVTSGWFRVDNARLGRRLEYRWDESEFPWLCIWTQHRSRTTPPWNGITRAKGLEFSTKPFPEGRPPESRSSEYQGRPTTCALNPGETLSRTFTARWSELPLPH
jgi:hypothetical protein